jgi:adenine specific DNA methylase Mod
MQGRATPRAIDPKYYRGGNVVVFVKQEILRTNLKHVIEEEKYRSSLNRL